MIDDDVASPHTPPPRIVIIGKRLYSSAHLTRLLASPPQSAWAAEAAPRHRTSPLADIPPSLQPERYRDYATLIMVLPDAAASAASAHASAVLLRVVRPIGLLRGRYMPVTSLPDDFGFRPRGHLQLFYFSGQLAIWLCRAERLQVLSRSSRTFELERRARI